MLDLGTEYIDEFENKENTKNKFIFVNESLTKRNKIKLSKTRELLKKHVKYIWVKKGKIFIQEDDKSKIIEIKSKDHIESIYQKYEEQ